MKIGISARHLSLESGGMGVKSVLENLIDALLAQDTENEYFVFINDKQFSGRFPGSTEVLLENNNKLVWDYILFPRECSRRKIDVMLFPNNVVPFSIKPKKIVIVNDLAYFDNGMTAYKFLDTLYMKRMIPSSLKRADKIIAISHNTERDIKKFIGIDGSKITVAHLAASDKFKVYGKEALEKTGQKYGLDRPFILNSGTLSPRKNIERLLRVFESLSKEFPHDLVLTGGYSWSDKSIKKAASTLKGRIKILGYIPEEDLIKLYNLADLFVYPSLWEGFGIPILEAMQCGCPVASSSATSLPEVGGDAVRYFNPYDEKEMEESIESLLKDRQVRKELSEKGLIRAKGFSWDRTASSVLEVINNL